MENMSLEEIHNGYFDVLDNCYSKNIKNETALFMYMVTGRMNNAAEKQENLYNMHPRLRARLKAERKRQNAEQTEASLGR